MSESKNECCEQLIEDAKGEGYAQGQADQRDCADCEEARDDGYAEGHNDGYDSGYIDGESNANEETAEAVDDANAEIAALNDQLSNAADEILDMESQLNSTEGCG